MFNFFNKDKELITTPISKEDKYWIKVVYDIQMHLPDTKDPKEQLEILYNQGANKLFFNYAGCFSLYSYLTNKYIANHNKKTGLDFDDLTEMANSFKKILINKHGKDPKQE